MYGDFGSTVHIYAYKLMQDFYHQKYLHLKAFTCSEDPKGVDADLASSKTHRAQYSLVKEYTVNHIRNPGSSVRHIPLSSHIVLSANKGAGRQLAQRLHSPGQPIPAFQRELRKRPVGVLEHQVTWCQASAAREKKEL